MEIHLFWGHKVKGQGHESQKQCRRGCLHSCECWRLLVSTVISEMLESKEVVEVIVNKLSIIYNGASHRLLLQKIETIK